MPKEEKNKKAVQETVQAADTVSAEPADASAAAISDAPSASSAPAAPPPDSDEAKAQKPVARCPSCTAPNHYNPALLSYRCISCGDWINTPSSASVKNANLVSEAAALRSADIKTPAAAKAYIGYLFDHYDWACFAKDPSAFTVAEIDAVLDRMTHSYGDQSAVWEMNFEYLCVCLEKKAEHIEKGLHAVIDDYTAKRHVNKAHNDFDCLKESADTFIKNLDRYAKNLGDYYHYAQKYGLSEAQLQQLKARELKLFSERLEKLRVPSVLEDYVEVRRDLADECQKAAAERYAKRKLNAPALYQKGVTEYKSGNCIAAARTLAKISEYGDSAEFLKKINLCARAGAFLILRDKPFYIKNNMLYPAFGRLIAETPVAPQTGLVYFFADDYYYASKGSSSLNWFNTDVPFEHLKGALIPKPKKSCLVFYGALSFPQCHAEAKDFTDGEFVILVRGNPASYNLKKEFFAKHQITAECEMPAPEAYDLWVWDAVERRPKLIRQNIFEFQNKKDDAYYYIAYRECSDELLKKKRIELEKALFSTDTYCGRTKLLIHGKAEIREILDDKSVIFTRVYDRQGPDNITIYRKPDIDSHEEQVLAQNVYRYYGCYEGKVFYRVGNSRVQSLYCVDAHGGEPCEVMRYMKAILFHDEDYIYTYRGKNDLYTIFRLPISGGSEQEIAFGVEKLFAVGDSGKKTEVFIEKGRLYYLDYAEKLYSVRLNGTGRKELIPEVDRVLGIKKNKIFYIAEDDNGVYSLYKMNLDGSIRQKVFYNIRTVCNYADDRIIYVAENTCEYEQELYADITDAKLVKLINKTFRKIWRKNERLRIKKQRHDYVFWKAGYAGETKDLAVDASSKALLKNLNKSAENKLDKMVLKYKKLQQKTPKLGAEYHSVVDYDCIAQTENPLAHIWFYPNKQYLKQRKKNLKTP
ncbi:MAG: DUF5050 domain-containing protein [Firmicutes bacterium]|nr:DUF5050 domain-containing protein [Bacillota bacterium]